MTNAQAKPTLTNVLGNINFRLLWIGQGTSLLGDQFFLIAIPWLTLRLTNDPLALGGVLALAGIPRALFMLLGGAVTDRYAPRVVMLISDALRLVLVGLIAILVGILLVGFILRLVKNRLGPYLVGVTAAFGLALIALGLNSSTIDAFLILLGVGIGNGTLLITLMTALQRQTPKEMLGRIMSLIMLASVGLVPVSQALTGGLLKLSLTGVFLGAGVLILVTSLWLAFQPALETAGRLVEIEKQ